MTTAFVIWDRWARGRPLARVTAKKLGVNPFKYIRIKNPGPADVFILAVRAYPQKVYAISKDHSTDAIVGAASFNVDVNVVLWQGEEHEYGKYPSRSSARWRTSRFASSSIGAKQVRVGCVRSLS